LPGEAWNERDWIMLLAVADIGIGMTSDQMAKLSRNFYGKRYDGTGVPLAVSSVSVHAQALKPT
jgi:hypothetical protein